jgi:DnaJ domain
MEDSAALRLALDLLHVPWRVKLLRSEPLPRGLPLLLRIAGGEVEAELVAAKMVDRSRDVVREAAAFFIEQILLFPEADSYRALGTTSEATATELRRNMGWLMAWLHPDRTRDGEQSVFVARVTRAWNDLKTPDRRAAYDAILRRRAPANRKSDPPGPRRRARAGGLGRVLSFLLGRHPV